VREARFRAGCRELAAGRAAVYFGASHKSFVLQTSRQDFAVNTA
jgi:hypothetical protein